MDRVPLAIDTGLRFRFRDLVVPGATLAVTTLVCLAARRSPVPLQFLWLVLGVGCGTLLARYFGRLQSRNEHDWAQHRSADERRDYLAGQNAVAMGADSVVDGLTALLPILGRPEGGTVLWELGHAWKTKLANTTTEQAAYLGQVVLEWASEHNRHPDLSSLVEPDLASGQGTTILTGVQTVEFTRLLHSAGLQGQVIVRLANPTVVNRPPGGAIQLLVNELTLKVAADPKSPPRIYDPGPAIFIIVAVIILIDMTFLGLRISVTAGLVGVGLSLAAAWWSHQQLHRLGPSARSTTMTVAVAGACIYTALAARGINRPVSTGGLETTQWCPG